jgi:hypothetical protein
MADTKTTHPLEKFFNIESGTTDLTTIEKNTELKETELYDEKDEEIEGSFQEVYDKALHAYEQLKNEMLDVESKYMPRFSEVANQHLNTALDAAQAKLKLKELKEKMTKDTKRPANSTNILQINTFDLIKKLKEQARPIDVNFSEIKEPDKHE